MSDRPWNGKLMDNDYQGEALMTIIIDKLLAPCIVMVMAAMTYLVATAEVTRMEMVAGIIVSVPLSIVLAFFMSVFLSFTIVIVLAVLFFLFVLVEIAVDAWR